MPRVSTGPPRAGTLDVIFPSAVGTLRDPNNFGKQWRKVRDDLGVAESTSHTFRKSVATLIDDEGLPARVGADHLGHRNISMTQDKYMPRGRQHSEVPDLLDKAVAINDGCPLPGHGKGHLTWGGRGSNPRPMDYESTALTD